MAGVTLFFTEVGATTRRSTVITPGSAMVLYSTPASTSRPTVAVDLSAASSTVAAKVAWGQPSLPASI